MTHPPSAVAQETLNRIRQLINRGRYIDALNCMEDYTKHVAAQAVAAERAKPAASDHEAAMALMRKLGGGFNEQEWVATVAAALAERGERERERAASLIQPTMRPFWNSAGDGIIDGMLDECEQALIAAIRNQTGD